MAIIFSKSISDLLFFILVSYCIGKNISRNTLYSSVRLFVAMHMIEQWLKTWVKQWVMWGYEFAFTHHFNSDIAMLHIDETPVKVGM